MVLADANLYTSPIGSSSRTKITENGAVGLNASRDGSRCASYWTLAGDALEIHDLSGELVGGAQAFNDSFLPGKALSPSGDRFAYRDPSSFRDTPSTTDGPTLYVSTINGPAPSVRTFGYREAPGADDLFLTEDLMLLEEDDPAVAGTAVTRFRTLSLDASAARTVVGLKDTAAFDLSEIVVDPTGTRIAYLCTPMGGGSCSLEVAPLSITGTTVTVGAPTVLATGAIGQAAFRRDSSALVFVNGTAPSRDLLTVPVTGGTATPFGLPTPTIDEEGVAFGVKGPATTPAAPTVGRALLNGTQATIRYTTPDSRSEVVRWTRTSPGLPTVERASSDGYLYSGDLVLGHDYTYTIRATDRSGYESDARTVSLVATAPPVLTVPDPTSARSTTTTFPVVVVPTGNAPTTRYSVDQRDAAATMWTRWFTLRTEFETDFDLGGNTLASFGRPASGDQAGTTSTAGRTYVFRGQALDVHGNATAPVESDRAVVPFDQSRATFSGSTQVVGRYGAYGGSTTCRHGTAMSSSTRWPPPPCGSRWRRRGSPSARTATSSPTTAPGRSRRPGRAATVPRR